jgi:HD-like signal output (HDOD) protein
VLPKLKRLLSDGNSSLHEVVALVRLDPGIAARVLQIGNSAYYGQGLRCYTVDEAIHRVGYEQVYELVANAVASEVLVRPLTSYEIGCDELWQSSVACAVAAESLAELLNLDRDIAYTIGLLHRVGLVAIDDWAQRCAPGFRFERCTAPFENCEQERQMFGFHNAEVGAALLRLWEFPAVMSEPVRWQYLPNATAAHRQLASLLGIAKWIRNAALTAEAAPMRIGLAGAVAAVDLSIQQMSACVAAVRTRLREISCLLDDNAAEQCIVAFPAGDRTISAVR